MKNWASTLDKITNQSQTEFGTLTNEQLNWKPNPNTWSIAQNLDHLMVVNETYYPVLASLKEGIKMNSNKKLRKPKDLLSKMLLFHHLQTGISFIN